MLTAIAIAHVLIALALIVLVLVQDSKGGGAMGMFGGGNSSSVLGTGAADFMTKLTRSIATVFAISCLALAYLTTSRNTSTLDKYVPPAAPNALTETSKKDDAKSAESPNNKNAAETAPQDSAPNGNSPAKSK